MNDHIKYITQLAGRSALSFLKINITGQALIIGIAIISISVLLYNLMEWRMARTRFLPNDG
jgi:predicted membrane protein